MRIPMKPLLILLLAVLLPLRGYTFTPHCEPHLPHCADGRSAHYAEDRSAHAAQDNGPGDKRASRAHGCGDCCGGVAAV
jgi:hypothetical protein